MAASPAYRQAAARLLLTRRRTMATPRAPGAGAAGRSLQGIRVLVVDDSADVRDLLAAVLAGARRPRWPPRNPPNTHWKRSAPIGPTSCCATCTCPGVDGFELIHRVRAWERASPRPPIPAAAVSAYASLGQRLRHARDEFQAFLAKPVDPDTLIKTVLELSRQVRLTGRSRKRAAPGQASRRAGGAAKRRRTRGGFQGGSRTPIASDA